MITLSATKSKKTFLPQSVLGRVKSSYPRVRRILVPLDFSGKSRQALRYAVPLAERFSAKIILLHVIQPVYNVSPEAGFNFITREQTQAALRRLEEMAATHLPKALRGQRIVRIGIPSGEILAAANRLDVDMIALTTHGHSGLKRFFIGSTAEQVMRHATCPVLSIRRQ